jgi:tryptophan synthase beta chain
VTVVDVPGAWYSILPELDFELPPDLPPPGGPVSAVRVPIPRALVRQEMSGKQWIGIPPDVLGRYRQWRPTPLRRAHVLERVLGTRCRIYYKYEGGNLSGTHQLNTAVAQAHYYRRAGAKRLTTGTGSGHWGTAVAVACAMFGLECRVYMERSSYLAQPYRKTIMELLGATVVASPSALAEAAADAEEPGTFFAAGRAETYSLLHQTVIGLETREQLLAFGERPDVLVGALGGGSELGGLVLPFLGAARCGGPPVRCLSAEPTACPKLTRGRYAYDFIDASGTTGLRRMYTLGHTFAPSGMHAGGLGQHGTAKLISALYRHGMIQAAAYPQRAVFGSALLFAETEGILPGRESGYAVHGAVMEAHQADQGHRSECIVMVIGAHGMFDLAAYESFRNGTLADGSATEEQIAAALAALPVRPDAARHP